MKCWFITLEEPTADQRACRKEIKGCTITCLMWFPFLSSKPPSSMLGCICNCAQHKFGSVYDPRTQNATEEVPYIEVGLRIDGQPPSVTVDDLAEECSKARGSRFWASTASARA